MIRLGLTGSIAMGKSTVARQFARLGVKLFDSDAAVHKLLSQNKEAIAAVTKLFPKVNVNNVIDRKMLGEEVFGDKAKVKKLESVLHPLIWKAQADFLKRERARRTKIVLFDIPLLFETGAERRMDYTVTVFCPPFLQEQRALDRMHMSKAKFEHIRKHQMNIHDKRKRADFVIHTGLGKWYSLKEVKRILHLV